MAPFGLKPSDVACCTATSGLLNVVEICSREAGQALYASRVGPPQRHQFDAIRWRYLRYIGRIDLGVSDRREPFSFAAQLMTNIGDHAP